MSDGERIERDLNDLLGGDDESIALPGFTDFEYIGEGGMGVVYFATQISLDRQLAIKILNRMVSENDQERFFAEAKMLARVSSHPNIVTLFDCRTITYEGEDTLCLVMEFIDGYELGEALSNITVTVQTVHLWMSNLCDAVGFAHEQGLIHRDIKPNNILLAMNGHLYLSDFGIARDTESQDTSEGTRSLGTRGYSAPEVTGNTGVSIQSDIYSCGVILLTLLTGKDLGFNRSGLSNLEGLDWHAVVDKATADDPKERYENAGELQKAISRCCDTTKFMERARFPDRPKLSEEQKEKLRIISRKNWLAFLIVWPVVIVYSIHKDKGWWDWLHNAGDVMFLIFVVGLSVIAINLDQQREDMVSSRTETPKRSLVKYRYRSALLHWVVFFAFFPTAACLGISLIPNIGNQAEAYLVIGAGVIWAVFGYSLSERKDVERWEVIKKYDLDDREVEMVWRLIPMHYFVSVACVIGALTFFMFGNRNGMLLKTFEQARESQIDASTSPEDGEQ